ncbi:PREDICTED: inducible metalloproteinase inhibitor protein-like [Nicrophorus vespilloides]|uniref:Inducible metalloproteinase inhibitor protein-like n=1 Tax=Nicrophorus vespilloides TaxID=110193 RepID=A0ABM1MH46_NICVS|nr:PREDICTED: inducible metalloproteinase inhibitor protein-like [Nicrophorus vespilloides]
MSPKFVVAITIFIILVLVQFQFTSAAGRRFRCRKQNEHYECGSMCQTRCTNLGKKCRIQTDRCKDGCYCKNGFARDTLGECIPVDKCPKK